MQNKKSKAFTFAEMIITMIILSVIVAVTMPLLSGRQGDKPAYDPWKYIDGSNDAIHYKATDLSVISLPTSIRYFMPTDNFRHKLIVDGELRFSVDDEYQGSMIWSPDEYYMFGVNEETFRNGIGATRYPLHPNPYVHSMAIGINADVVAGKGGQTAIGNNAKVQTDRPNASAIGRGVVNNHVETHGKGSAFLGNASHTVIVEQAKLYRAVGPYSDRRLKKDIKPYKKSLSDILKLKPMNYTYKKDKKQKLRSGFIAQELQEVFPNAVIEDTSEDKFLSVKKEDMLYAMVNAIKELDVSKSKVKKENIKLKKRLHKLEQELKKIKKERAGV